MSLLAEILANKDREVGALRAIARTGTRRVPLDVVTALRRRDALRLIAEVKLRSPSAGKLSSTLTPEDRALAYAESGAAMVSVLCDAPFFDGSWSHLAAARARLDAAACAVPLLAKEFVVDERQIQEARDRGADSVLLIARIVSAPRLAALVHAARTECIEPIVEVTDERELEAALKTGARVVGVNVRNLDTLHMDSTAASRTIEAVPRDIVAVHFSGLREPRDVAEVARGRADAALVGEALMRRDDPRALLRAMAAAAGG